MGRIPTDKDRVKEPICDFCGAVNPGWEFPAENFINTETNTESVGEWLACDTCAAYVCAGHWEALAQRTPLNPALRLLMIGMDPESQEAVIDWARRFHQQFKEHRTGEPVRVRRKEEAKR